jgi:hypothetical protein
MSHRSANPDSAFPQKYGRIKNAIALLTLVYDSSFYKLWKEERPALFEVQVVGWQRRLVERIRTVRTVKERTVQEIDIRGLETGSE